MMAVAGAISAIRVIMVIGKILVVCVMFVLNKHFMNSSNLFEIELNLY